MHPAELVICIHILTNCLEVASISSTTPKLFIESASSRRRRRQRRCACPTKTAVRPRHWRAAEADLPAAGFTDSWDDGFNLGVAHLFWIEESLGEENNTLSTASVPFERFEALVDQKWIPLATHLAPAPRAVPPKADQTQQPRLITEPRLLTCLKRLIGSA